MGEVKTVNQARFSGRPPFAPFLRAAAAFASLRDCPPFRPSATAAGFLRGKRRHLVEGAPLQPLPQGGGRVVVFVVARATTGAMGLAAVEQAEGGAPWNLPEALDAVGCRSLAIHEEALSHGLTIPYRLGYVN